MRILDRYILKHVVFGYFFIAAIFVGFYLFIDISSNITDFLRAKTPASIIVEYYIMMLPLIFTTVSPYSLLMSLLYGFGEMNRNNEVISMRVSGISSTRTIIPIIIFALILSFTALFIQENILSQSQRRIADLKMKFLQDNFSEKQEEKNIAFSSQDTILFARRFLPQKKQLLNVLLFHEDSEGNISKKTICHRLQYADKQWTGYGVLESTLDENGAIIGSFNHWEEKIIPLNATPTELTVKKSLFNYFSSLKSIRRDIKKLKKAGGGMLLTRKIIEYHKKISDPFTHFFLILGILPFALEIKKRKATRSALTIGLLFGFFYYTLGHFSIALGKTGILLPAGSVWLAPLFFSVTGITSLFLMR